MRAAALPFPLTSQPNQPRVRSFVVVIVMLQHAGQGCLAPTDPQQWVLVDFQLVIDVT